MKLTIAQLKARNDRVAIGATTALKENSEDKDPPKEFRVFKFGAYKTSKGTYLFDKEAADSVMAAYNDQGNKLPFDWEHSMAPGQPAKRQPAAGWFTLELRDDGLWATNCKFGKQATEDFKDGSYAYFSPLIEHDTEEPFRIRSLMNIALTNLPATKHLEPLVALSLNATDRRTAALSALAFDQVRDAIRDALQEAVPGAYLYIVDVYDDAVIVSNQGKLLRIPYEMAGAKAQLGDPVVEVYRHYVPAEELEDPEPPEVEPESKTKRTPASTPKADPDEDDGKATAFVAFKAVPFSKGRVVNTPWDSEAAEQRLRKWASEDGSGDKGQVDFGKYAKGFAFVGGEGKHFGEFHLPHHDVVARKLVVHKGGVEDAAQKIHTEKWGEKLPDSDRDAVKQHLSQHFAQWSAKAPWDSDTQPEAQTMKTLLAALSLAETCNEAQALAALTARTTAHEALNRDLVALTGAKDPAEALVKIAALKASAAEQEAKINVLNTKLSMVEGEKLAVEVTSLVASGMASGQIVPAQKDFWTEQGKTNIASLKKYLETAPKQVSIVELNQPTTAPKPPTVSELEMQYAKTMGIDPAKVAQYKAEHGIRDGSAVPARSRTMLSEIERAQAEDHS